MPIAIDIEPALLKWQAKNGRRMTYAELAEAAGMSLASLNRLKSGQTLQADLRKLNAICKVLECEPADILFRMETGEADPLLEYEIEERKRILEEVERLRDEEGQG
jgi:putative transcriptional regulator